MTVVSIIFINKCIYDLLIDEVIPRHVTATVTSNVRNPHQVAASMPLTGIIIIIKGIHYTMYS